MSHDINNTTNSIRYHVCTSLENIFLYREKETGKSMITSLVHVSMNEK